MRTKKSIFKRLERHVVLLAGGIELVHLLGESTTGRGREVRWTEVKSHRKLLIRNLHYGAKQTGT